MKTFIEIEVDEYYHTIRSRSLIYYQYLHGLRPQSGMVIDYETENTYSNLHVTYY